jgi:prolyl oligopeptidase
MPLSEAQTLFEGEKTDVSVGTSVIKTPRRQYDVLYRGMTFYTSHTYFLENGKKIKLDIPDDASFGGIFKNQILVHLKSDWTVEGRAYQQGHLISLDYDAFLQGSRAFQTVIAPDAVSSISSTSETKNLMLVTMLNNVRSELFAYTFDNGKWKSRKVDAPDFGNLYIASTDEFFDRYFFGYQDFLTPSSLYYVARQGTTPEKIKTLPEFFDASRFAVKQNVVASKDGTRIPYFLVYPQGMTCDGTHPTLLSGYGGFEIARRPSYSATVGSAWLEKGGVHVLANIRGGGEFGPKWHRAGLKENRQRIYDDFIAVAEDLIKHKITTPDHLGISGGSNGGLLVGVMFTQRPDLFNGVVCAVPLLDMKRFNKLLAGASWMGEYGNPDISEQWAYISKYSPYQNLYADKDYPEVFFTTSTRDDRVHPGHARKMARKMEAMGHAFYYFENIEGGHGGVSTNDQRAMRDALIYSYLLKQLK